MLIKKFECDVCGVERKEANHWFICYAPSSPDESIMIVAFTFEDAERRDAICICGEGCLHKWISSNLHLLSLITELRSLSPFGGFTPPVESFNIGEMVKDVTSAMYGVRFDSPKNIQDAENPPLSSYEENLITESCPHSEDRAACGECNQLSKKDEQMYKEAAHAALYREKN
jgi:hypothetical protein